MISTLLILWLVLAGVFFSALANLAGRPVPPWDEEDDQCELIPIHNQSNTRGTDGHRIGFSHGDKVRSIRRDSQRRTT